MLAACRSGGQTKTASKPVENQKERIVSSLSQIYQYRGVYIKLGNDWSEASTDDSSEKTFTLPDGRSTLSLCVYPQIDASLESVPEKAKELSLDSRDDWYQVAYEEKGNKITLVGWGDNGAGFTCTVTLEDDYASDRNLDVIQKIFGIMTFDPETAATSGETTAENGFAADQHVDELTITGFNKKDEDPSYDWYYAVFTVQNNTSERVRFKSLDLYEFDADGVIVEHQSAYPSSSESVDIEPGQSYAMEVLCERGDGIASFQVKGYSYIDTADKLVTGVFSQPFEAQNQ